MSYYSLLGPNAIRALKELGILDSVLAKAEQDEPDVRPFSYISGLGEHEHIYDVSVSYCALTLLIHSFFMQSTRLGRKMLGWASIDQHSSRHWFILSTLRKRISINAVLT